MTKIYDLATRAVKTMESPLKTSKKNRVFVNPKNYVEQNIDSYRKIGEKAQEALEVIVHNKNIRTAHNPHRRNIFDSLKNLHQKEMSIVSETFNPFTLPIIDAETRTNRGKRIFSKESAILIKGYNRLVSNMEEISRKLLNFAEERGSDTLGENIYDYLIRESLAIQLEKTPSPQFQDRLKKFFCKYDNDANKREAYKNIIRETKKMGESISVKA